MEAKNRAKPLKRTRSRAVSRCFQRPISDWKFSHATEENAYLVWAYEIHRQLLADFPDDFIPEHRARLEAELAKPSSQLSSVELNNWYIGNYGGLRGSVLYLEKNGYVRCGYGSYLFEEALGYDRTPRAGDLHFSITLNQHLWPELVKRALGIWVNERVVPQLRYKPIKTGKGPDYLSWLADLCVYRAGRYGVRQGKIPTNISEKQPRGRGFENSKRRVSPVGISDAKRETESRMADIRAHSFAMSDCGAGNETPEVIDLEKFAHGPKKRRREKHSK